MTYLDRIVVYKKEELKSVRKSVSQSDLVKKGKDTELPRRFDQAFSGSGFCVIAEIKKASPSLGVIRSDFKPLDLAYEYEEAGAVALSVLTDEHFFEGSLDTLARVKSCVKIPCLRKDFTLSEYHIYEARSAGADAILLIAAILDDFQMKGFLELATELKMATLIEIHDEAELMRVLPLKPKMVGVNNRNLKSFEVDIKTSFDLVQKMPKELVKISESGLKTNKDLDQLGKAGFDGFLIGETFLKQKNVGDALRKIMGR